jgi:hypothetical protein
MTSTSAPNLSSAAGQITSPSAPAITLSEDVVLRAGIVIFLPSPDRIGLDLTSTTPADPDPPKQWAQDGFAVAAITNYDGLAAAETLKQGLDALQNLNNLKVKDKFAVIGERVLCVYESRTSHPPHSLRAKTHQLGL